MAGSAEISEYSKYVPSVFYSGVITLEARFINFAYAMHSHEDFTVGVTLSGVQSFRCGGTRQHSTPGKIMTFNPDEAHDGRAGTGAGYAYRVIYIPVDLMWSVASDLWQEHSAECFFPRNIHPSSDLASGLYQASLLLADDKAPTLEVQSVFTDVLAHLILRHGERRKTPSKIRPECKIVQDAVEIIRDNPGVDIKLEELAGIFGRSPYSFLRLFRKTTGIPPHRYQVQCRLRMARRLIARGAPLAAAALESGFCDQSHLNRRFRQAYGITPGQYRDSLAGLNNKRT